MRNQLIQYVELLFAGNPETEDIKQEILQNTLDRFDDLVARGKSPEAAYSLAISGIGDVSELLAGNAAAVSASAAVPAANAESEETAKKAKGLRAIAVALYICCPVPLFVFQNEVGLSLLLVVVAIATVLMILAGKENRQNEKNEDEAINLTPQQKLRKSIHTAVSTVGLVVYFLVSFTTGAWHLTWLIFPIAAAVNGLVTAVMDLKEN